MLTDQATMAASIEGRVPFVDHNIVEFAFSISKRQNLLNGKAKGLLKETLKDKLPNNLMNRKKEGNHDVDRNLFPTFENLFSESILFDKKHDSFPDLPTFLPNLPTIQDARMP